MTALEDQRFEDAVSAAAAIDHEDIDGPRYVEAIRGARATRKSAVDFWEYNCDTNPFECLSGRIGMFPWQPFSTRGGAHLSERARGIPEGWFGR